MTKKPEPKATPVDRPKVSKKPEGLAEKIAAVFHSAPKSTRCPTCGGSFAVATCPTDGTKLA